MEPHDIEQHNEGRVDVINDAMIYKKQPCCFLSAVKKSLVKLILRLPPVSAKKLVPMPCHREIELMENSFHIPPKNNGHILRPVKLIKRTGTFLIYKSPAEDTPVLAMADEKPKEGVKTENNDHINLKVAGHDGSVVHFKIKRHTPLSKLMKAYCERQGLSMRQIRFRYDGQPINETDTPAQLEMEDEDTIDVFQQQTRGVY
ncbi:hypothetical protein STEG23_025708 [Scotinomys teguina]